MDWRGQRWMPGADSGQFAKNVLEGWQQPKSDGKGGYEIRNTFGLLSWKVTGGTITPKRAQALTIPLVPAKRVPARAFEDKLFRAGQALVHKIGNQLEAVYALKKSVTQKSWPGALPPLEEVEKVFNDALIDALPK